MRAQAEQIEGRVTSTREGAQFSALQRQVALKAAGIAGPRYLPLEGYVDGGGDAVDIQVPEPKVSD